MDVVRIITGFDPREAVGWHTFVEKLIECCRVPYTLEVMSGDQRDGTNAFTYSRFSIPERLNWAGWALWLDGADMLPRACLGELWALRDPLCAVQVVKHNYQTLRPLKYIGTEMEAPNEHYPRKNWSSVVLWNCGHPAHFRVREAMRSGDGAYLHRFSWLEDKHIGELPREWNWLDEYGENPAANLVHYTTGIPGFTEYRDAPHAGEWRSTMERSLRGLQTHAVSEQSGLTASER